MNSLFLKKKLQTEPLTLLLDSDEHPELSQTIHAAVNFLRENTHIIDDTKSKHSLKIMQPYGHNQVIGVRFKNIHKSTIDDDSSSLHLKTDTIEGVWFLPEQNYPLDYFSTDPVVRSRPWDSLLYHLSRSITAIIKHENLQERFVADQLKYTDFNHYEFIQPFANGHVIQAHISWTDGRQRIAFEFTNHVYVLPRITTELPYFTNGKD